MPFLQNLSVDTEILLKKINSNNNNNKKTTQITKPYLPKAFTRATIS